MEKERIEMEKERIKIEYTIYYDWSEFTGSIEVNADASEWDIHEAIKESFLNSIGEELEICFDK